MKIPLLLQLALVLTIGTPSDEPKNSVFVSAKWLSEHLNDPNVVVVHVAFNRRDYQVGHIPGARFLWYNWLAVSTPDASTEMPPVEQADTLFESYGITTNSHIVLCFTGQSVSTTTRCYLAFSYFGFGNQTSLLDGGLEAWKSEKNPVSTETPTVKRTALKLRINSTVVADANWVKTSIGSPSVGIIDARSVNFYEGSGGGIVRTGHIKGAKNIPFTSVVDSTNRLKNLDSLRTMFETAGLKKGMKVVSYCHVGQQATVIYAVAKMLGFGAAVYDGSFEDWNVRGEEYPVEKPETKQ